MNCTINVTKEDIANAVQALSRENYCSYIANCPIAQAVKRQFPGEYVAVGATTIIIGATEYRAVNSKLLRQYTNLAKRNWRESTPGSLELVDARE